MSEDFKKGLIKYGLENNYIERTEEGLKFVGSRYNNTEQQIYNMLTENTGTHFLDSGGANGRHWQRNIKKSLEDFRKEEVFNSDAKDIWEIEKSLFHHLKDSVKYNADLNEGLQTYLKHKDLENWREPVEQYLQSKFPDEEINHINTYNVECWLSQTLQIIKCWQWYKNETIALAIHNGADVRGGYTDFKIFDIDTDAFYNWHPENYEYILDNANV